jgi:hypothetical protein
MYFSIRLSPESASNVSERFGPIGGLIPSLRLIGNPPTSHRPYEYLLFFLGMGKLLDVLLSQAFPLNVLFVSTHFAQHTYRDFGLSSRTARVRARRERETDECMESPTPPVASRDRANAQMIEQLCVKIRPILSR